MPKWLKVVGVIVACVVMVAAVVVRIQVAADSEHKIATSDTLIAAVHQTEAARSEHVKFDLTVRLAGFKISTTEKGVVSAAKKQAQFIMTLHGLGDLGGLGGGKDGAGSVGGLLDGLESGSETRVVDGQSYTELGSLAAFLPDVKGKKWVRSPANARTGSSSSGSSLLSGSNLDPAQRYLVFLKSLVPGSVATVGDGTVGGKPATHYRASLDFAKLDRNTKSAAGEQAKHSKPRVAPIDLWVDDDGRLVKVRGTIDSSILGPLSSVFTGTVVFTQEFTEFGIDVNVQAPPDDEVLDASDLRELPLPDLGRPAPPDSTSNV